MAKKATKQLSNGWLELKGQTSWILSALGGILLSPLAVITLGYFPFWFKSWFGSYQRRTQHDDYFLHTPYPIEVMSRIAFVLSVAPGILGLGILIREGPNQPTLTVIFDRGVNDLGMALLAIVRLLSSLIMGALGVASLGLVPAIIARYTKSNSAIHKVSNAGFLLSCICGVGLIGYGILLAIEWYQNRPAKNISDPAHTKPIRGASALPASHKTHAHDSQSGIRYVRDAHNEQNKKPSESQPKNNNASSSDDIPKND